MSIKNYGNRLLLTCIVLLVMCVTILHAEPERKAAAQPVEAAQKPPAADPYADAQILVEAFVVEVTTAGLKDLGVSPLGQTPDGISIAKLTDCLMKEKGAKVISGAKLTAKHNQEGAAKEEKTIYVKEKWKINNSVPGESELYNISFKDYRSEKNFYAQTKIASDNHISLEYKYSEFGVLMDNYDPNEPAPLNCYTYNWEGQISLQPSKPCIAAAVQNRDNVVFLVLTATIQKDTPPPAAEERKIKSK